MSLKGILLFAIAACAAAFSRADAPPLSPDAEELVATMRRQARAYRQKTDRTRLFVRAQVKYGLERDDYIHKWYDRPLASDVSLKKFQPKNHVLNPEGWKTTAADLLRGGFDGLGVCHHRFSYGVRELSESTGTGILVEMPYSTWGPNGFDALMKCAEDSYSMRNSFRIDGKVVLSRYPESKESQLDAFSDYKRELNKKYGDSFILMPYTRAFDHAPKGAITAAFLEEQRESLRRKLRKIDGFFSSGWVRYMYGKRYDGEFERKVLVPFLQSVLAEPEFAGKKYLAMPIYPGHENCYLWRYSWDCEGTETLCDQFETMLALKPDYALCCEWDEENENTHFRPTVAQGTSALRIVRHYADCFAGRAPSLFPGDEGKTATPNLIISFRKSIIAGEPLEVDVRNIPDGTFKGKRFDASFRWKDTKGKTVKEFRPQSLKADKCESVWFKIDASSLVGEHAVLIPELNVAWNGGSAVFSDGLWPVDLNPARALDARWAKQPLRDMAKGVSGTVAATDCGKDGMCEVFGNVASGTELKSVEVLEGPDTVYMHGTGDDAKALAPGTSADRTTFRIVWQGYMAAQKIYSLEGTLRWLNVNGLRPIRTGGLRVEGDTWKTRGRYNVEHWPQTFFASVPNGEIADGELEVDLRPIFKGKIRLADVARLGAVGIAGIGGANLVASRCDTQIAMPPPYGGNAASFRFRFRPRTGSGVLRIQTIDAQGRVWRGKPFVFGAKTGKMRTVSVIERDSGKVSEFSIDESRLDEPVFVFSPDGGTALRSSAGTALGGVLGGYVPMVTGMGQGESIYGNPLAVAVKNDMPGWDDAAPRWHKEQDGGHSLSFFDCRFASLPMQLLPVFAGFELEMDVLPERLGHKVQGLIGDGNFGMGLWLLKDGTLEMRSDAFASPAKGPALAAGKWTKVRVVCDRRTVWVEVDGVKGVPVGVTGYSVNPVYTALGATPGYVNRIGAFFDGRIRSLAVRLK